MKEVSRRIQERLLPRNAPSLAGYDIAAGTTREDEGAGSSVWDWFELGDGRPALVTLDVPPGDLPAAHHLALVRAFLRELHADDDELGSLLARVNGAVSRTSPPGMGGHAACGVMALGAEGVSWLSAGNVPAGVIRREGMMDELTGHGPPLGVMEGFGYGAVDVPMKAGDVAVVLSHGSVGLFRGAADLVAELHGRPAGEVVEKLHTAIRKAQGETGREVSVLFIRKH